MIERPENQPDCDAEDDEQPPVVELERGLHPEQDLHHERCKRLHDALQESPVRVRVLELAPEGLEPRVALRSCVEIVLKGAVVEPRDDRSSRHGGDLGRPRSPDGDRLCEAVVTVRCKHPDDEVLRLRCGPAQWARDEFAFSWIELSKRNPLGIARSRLRRIGEMISVIRGIGLEGAKCRREVDQYETRGTSGRVVPDGALHVRQEGVGTYGISQLDWTPVASTTIDHEMRAVRQGRLLDLKGDVGEVQGIGRAKDSIADQRSGACADGDM